MFVALKAWYVGLSTLAKAGVITTGSVATLGTVGAVTPDPIITTENTTETVQINFETNRIKDPKLLVGQTKVETEGVVGSKEITYLITFSDGKEKSKEVMDEKTTLEPVTQVEKIGSKEVVEETKNADIAFEAETIYDSSLEKGKTKVTQNGSKGLKEISYKVTKIDGKEKSRQKIGEKVITKPKNKITAIGTKVASNCDTNYTPCVPIVSYDLNCPDIGFQVRVIGYDKHRFDRDNDGYGCESY